MEHDSMLDNQEGVSSKYQGGVSVEPAEIDLSLFNRLIKVSVIKASPSIKTLNDKNKAILDSGTTEKYINGLIFADYLLVLKSELYKSNQEFAIDAMVMDNLKPAGTTEARLFNWNYLCTELEVSVTHLFKHSFCYRKSESLLRTMSSRPTSKVMLIRSASFLPGLRSS